MTRRVATYPLVAIAAVGAAAVVRLTDVSPTARYAVAAGLLLVSVASALVWSERLMPRATSHFASGHPRRTAAIRIPWFSHWLALFWIDVVLVIVWATPIGSTSQVAVTVLFVVVLLVVVYSWLREAAGRHAPHENETPPTHRE